MSFHPNDISRRSRVAGILLLLTFVWLGSAFFRAQVGNHEEYALRSSQNRLREVPLPAPRGVIVDRRGRLIAESVPGYSVLLRRPERIRDLDVTADSLRMRLRPLTEIIPTFTEEHIEAAVRRFRRDPNRPVLVIADARFDEVSVLEERVADFPGLYVQSAPKRYYPDGPVVAAFVGYANEITEAELSRAEYADYKAGQQIGRTGLEREYEAVLRGKEGTSFIEVDARNREVRREGVRPELPPVQADTLYTNIDLDLQRVVVDLMEGDTSLTGGIIALDPETGGVLALHSNPSFDPNDFIGGISTEQYKTYTEDPRRPMYNKVIQGRYPPASTFKLVTAAMGMQRGLVSIDSRMPVPCTGGIYFGNRYWRCWDKRGHGNIDLRGAIAKSCNVFFYQLGQRIGMENILHDAIEMGMNQRSGIDLPNEMRASFPPDLAYYDRLYGPRNWTRAVALNLAIGQGENEATLANMARVYTAFATDGFAATPSVVRRAPERKRVLQLDDEQMLQLRLAMADVVSARGTAGRSQLQGITIAGKTGTAQNSEDRNRSHAWFLGFAPAEQPKIVVGVFLAFGEHGSDAAFLASRVIEAYLKQPTLPMQSTDETP
jgi:penicillin-binding protein 2